MTNLTFLAFFFTGYGLLMTVRTRLETQMTSLAACVNGSITLPGNEPSGFPVRDQWWKFRYPDDDWINIRYCDGSLNCVTMTSVLPDGTRVSIGAHESLVVERITQNSTKNRVQFLLEVFFEDNTVLRHSFEVNFTVICVWTWPQANLNLSEIFLGQYPPGQLKEIQLFDATGTNIAYLHTVNGASLEVTDDSRLMPAYWNRLKIISGFLILSGIIKADNGTSIQSKAFLNGPTMKTSMGSVSVKTIRIFVFNSTEPSLPPPSIFPNNSFSAAPGKVSSTKSSNESQTAGYRTLIVIISVVLLLTILIIALIVIVKKRLRSTRKSIKVDKLNNDPPNRRPSEQFYVRQRSTNRFRV
ncbi:uncharacterized protein [Montipora foliosa]|uniref:uncharacterized protein n=1 Tax=Montipora foliosa TaxID=591990 RepID=UPI0035F17384